MKHIMHIAMALTMLFYSAAAIPGTASAESLYSESGHSMFADRRASQVGDILTIIIDESATTSMQKGVSNSKEGEQDLAAGTGIFHFLAAANASQSDNFTANGSSTNRNTARGTVTVMVTDVQDNGNMMVEGTQSIWQNNNEHKITVQGVVRSDDVRSNNTILSSKVANATLRFDGKGPLNAKQRQGLLTQIFNILF